MFESAELGHQVDKTTYERAVPALREALLNAIRSLHGCSLSRCHSHWRAYVDG
jgi:hypothetical protein